MAKNIKIKLPKYIKRVIKEVAQLTEKIRALDIALTNDEFIKMVDGKQLSALNEQLDIMKKYQSILHDRISYDAMKEVEKEDNAKDVLAIQVTKKHIHIMTDQKKVIKDIINSAEKRMTGKL